MYTPGKQFPKTPTNSYSFGGNYELLAGQIACGVMCGRSTFARSNTTGQRSNFICKYNPNPKSQPLTLNPHPYVKVWDNDVRRQRKSTLWRSTGQRSRPSACRPLNTVKLAEESTFWKLTSRPFSQISTKLAIKTPNSSGNVV